jgi:arginyl-tRNA synthetase
MNLIKTIEAKFTQAFKNAFPELDLQAHPIEITRSTNARFGHYQCNSAMKFTKLLKTPPRDISNKVIENLQGAIASGEIQQCEVAGPGFINITLSDKMITQVCQNMLDKPHEKVAQPQRIIIDYPSCNAAKEMHVGHLRSAIIGDSLSRLFKFLGHDVVGLNHIGDWGTSFGMLISYIKRTDPGVLTGEKGADLTTLNQYYKASKKLFDEDPEFKKQSQLEVVQLQKGEPGALKGWETICEISRRAHQQVYDLLDVHVTERGESFYNPFLEDLIKDLESKNVITVSDGAKCIFIEGFANREGEPLPYMVQKSDGGFNYDTTDLAALRYRIETDKANRVIYVVDAGQSTHFDMLFAAAEKAGYLDRNKVRVEHPGFGVVLGSDGKKFKTRSGETERLIDLLNAAIEKAQSILIERNKETPSGDNAAQIHALAKALGINAVKYSDLSCNRLHDYVFSYDRMLRFDGNTAAFLMYSYVRIQGIKRKVQNAELAPMQLMHPSEVALGLHLAQFSEILYSIADDLMPNRLCDYLFELSEKFNGFFRDCRVEGVPEQNQRLALCELTAKTLHQGLSILGLETVDKM